MDKKQFAVIGLGRFGGNLCKEFYKSGLEVLAIDNDGDRVADYLEFSTHAVQADTTDETVVRDLGLRNFDYVIVAIGENIQASILTTLLLKEIGVERVWVKAQNDYHQKVLEKIGADRIIHPERDIAKRIAHHIVSEKIIDFIELSDEYSIVEIIASGKVDQKTLLDLDIRAKYGCTVVAIKRAHDITVSPAANMVINQDDILVVAGHNRDIERFEREGI
ncbi:potassium channel family protein [Bacillus sp. Marseille-P3661]|uniref:potassium channel family protein n=1 Tax=Bacillus sp. Marseille-P3661 TaxID=1936234 RepID=UPI000C84D396|nr:TrkA family potassium uptake protein [Bacillus sp. Marseille-P3661]